MTRYIIQDWAGNVIEPSKSWATFEDAWDYILGDLTDRLGLTEDDYQEYAVYPASKVRAKKYLGANDVRGGYVNEES